MDFGNQIRVEPRVHWFKGETLLPQHMRAQEDAILSESRLQSDLLGPPRYGIARLAIREEQLPSRLSFSELTVVFQNGQLCTKGGNATVGDLDLESLPGTECMIYLHLLERREPVEPEAGGLQREHFQLELSIEPVGDTSACVMPLARLEKSVAGGWAHCTTFVPPLLVLNHSPFLRAELERLDSLLVEFEDELKVQSAARYLRESNHFSARRTLVEARRLASLLANMRGQIRTHPYELVERLRVFYLEVCANDDVHPESYGIRPYDHENLADLIGGYLDALQLRLSGLKRYTTYNQFREWHGMMLIEPLPPALRNAKDVYLLVQWPDLQTEVSLEKVKLSHRERLPLVYRRSLAGIDFKRVDRTDFQHPFGSEVAFYRIDQNEDWAEALQANSVAFFATPELQAAQPSLYWRGE